MSKSLPHYIAYVGCYSKLEEGGIHILDINPNDGSFTRLGIVTGVADPTFLSLTPDYRRLYAGVREVAGVRPKGGVAMYRINGDQLEFSSFQRGGGVRPCYVSLNSTATGLFGANYEEGTGSYFPLDANGDILPEAHHFSHIGLPTGPSKFRQRKAHVHCAEVTPDGKVVYFVDLGIDTVKAYWYDGGKGDFHAMPEADIKAAPGAGPRHLLFARNGELAYVINEMASTVVVYRKDGDGYVPVQTHSLLPKNIKSSNSITAAAVKMTADGQTLLCSVRGYDCINVFSIEPDTGLLSLLAINPSGGQGPRDFAFMPGDRYVLVAHQYTNNLVCYELDRKNGKMTHVGDELEVPQGVCIKIGAVKN